MAEGGPKLARKPEIIVAFAGRQNSGKTSTMMHLTGTAQRPVNFPGSSVERVEAQLDLEGRRLRVVDLPGIASLNSISKDEEEAIEYLRGNADERPDVLAVVVDATKIGVELKLLGDLMTLGLPTLVILTKADVARGDRRPVDRKRLERELRLPVIEVNGLTGRGVEKLGLSLLAVTVDPPPQPLLASPQEIDHRVRPQTMGRGESFGERLDKIALHPIFGLPLLAALFYGVFQLIFVGADPFIGLIEGAQGWLSGKVAGAIAPGALQSFLVDGLINGVGSVLVFLPQIVILIAIISAMEGSGYMARAAFLLDRALSRFGLSGRSFVPMVSSMACAVPGVLAARIIEDERDRLATIAVSPLMSCSARLPVYVVLIGAFFPAAWAGSVLFGLYAMGIVTAIVVATLLRRTVLKSGQSALMMELPAWQPPVPRVIWGQVKTASREFIVLAGTLIFATAIVIWLLSYYPRPEQIHSEYAAKIEAAQEAQKPQLEAAEKAAYLEQSYLARAGKVVTPVFEPAGFDWRITVGVLAAFPARELIVPTLGILYSVGDVDPGEYTVSSLQDAKKADGLRDKLRAAKRADGSPAYDPLIALALMIFFALCSQCAATLGAIRRETRSWRWPVFVFTYMTVLAWLAAVVVYQVGRAAGFGA